MKIIYLTDSIQNPLTGIGRYAYELGTRLEKHESIEKILYFHQFNCVENLSVLLKKNKTLSDSANNHIRQNHFLRKCFRPLYVFYKNRCFLKTYSKHQDYLVHTPNYIAPSVSGRFISTIHDLSHIVYPEYHPKERVEYINKNLSKIFEKADHIITVSHFSKSEIIKYFKFDSDKLTVIPLGISSDFRIHSATEIENVLCNFNLIRNSYLLSVAAFEPRKNLDRLIDAYIRLPKSLKKKYPLVLVGAIGWLNKTLTRKITMAVASENIKFLGCISHEQLPALYAGARGVAYPSLYEGFGFQVLEAMASGVPVLTSAGTSMDEISGKLPILIDPYSIDSIKNGLEKLLTDELYRSSVQTQGIDHVKQYTWENCVTATIDVYKKIYEI